MHGEHVKYNNRHGVEECSDIEGAATGFLHPIWMGYDKYFNQGYRKKDRKFSVLQM